MFKLFTRWFGGPKLHVWETDSIPTYGQLEKELMSRGQPVLGIRIEAVDKKFNGKYKITWSRIEDSNGSQLRSARLS